MNEPHSQLPRTVAVVEDGIRRKLHAGVQVYVSLNGETVADFGLGQARPGVPMTSQTINLWLSAGKPLTVLAIARFWERGLLALDDRVCDHIPEFAPSDAAASPGKRDITIRHLLTHTGGFRLVDTGWPDAAWDDVIARICRAELESGWIPGRTAGYHVSSSWFILAEILRRIDGRPFSQLLRDEVCGPLGMHDTWIGLPPEQHEEYGNRIAIMYYRDKGELQPHPWHSPEYCAAVSPGGSTRGPIRELGRFYEMLLARGRHDHTVIVSPQTVEALTARHRVNQFDKTFQHIVDFGLGFIIDSNLYGAQTVPYGYGGHCSPRTFGHGGAQSTTGFADPEYGLVVAVAANGMPGEPQHNRRSRAINEAIYEDLGLVNRE